ncbi:MAG: hypothetical protein ACRBFS_01510 [Aureispira sp.]
MNKAIATIILVVGIGFGLFGFNKYNNSVETIKVIGLEFSAKNDSAVKEAYLLMGGGALLILGGLIGLVKK